MKKRPYENFREEELILRDHLALDRTILANERTLLSYVRTTLAVIVVGMTLIHLSRDSVLQGIGIVSIIIGILILAVGIHRSVRMSRKIHTKSARKRS